MSLRGLQMVQMSKIWLPPASMLILTNFSTFRVSLSMASTFTIYLTCNISAVQGPPDGPDSEDWPSWPPGPLEHMDHMGIKSAQKHYLDEVDHVLGITVNSINNFYLVNFHLKCLSGASRCPISGCLRPSCSSWWTWAPSGCHYQCPKQFLFTKLAL